jgi:hypothetical protein
MGGRTVTTSAEGASIMTKETKIRLCDRSPEKTDDAMARIRAFCRHFIRVYGVSE